MAATRAGGLKAARTVKQKYGKHIYEQWGRQGGIVSRGGPFSKDHQFASEMGKIGGKASRRDKAKKIVPDEIAYQVEKLTRIANFATY